MVNMEDQVRNRSLLSMKWKILVLCLKINHRSIDVLNLKVTTYMRSRFIRGMICVCSTVVPIYGYDKLSYIFNGRFIQWWTCKQKLIKRRLCSFICSILLSSASVMHFQCDLMAPGSIPDRDRSRALMLKI